MTKVLKFDGYSDDTFACKGPGIDVDFDTCASGRPVSMRVSSGEEHVIIVTGQYCPGDATGWQVAVAPGHDDPDNNPVPPWPMVITAGESPYSARLIIEAPDDVVVKLLGHDDDSED